MPSLVDYSAMDLRSAFDLAIMIEEDAQLRYAELERLLGDDPGGAGDVFRAMVVNEGKHRDELAARRQALFSGDPRIEISLLAQGVERPDVDDDELPRTAREALELALAAEQRSHAFYASAVRTMTDPAVRAFFEGLMEEEAEHAALLEANLARLDASGIASVTVLDVRRAHRQAQPAAAADAYPDRTLLQAFLPRFDAATQAVARGVILNGMRQEEVAAALGVSRRTVAFRLTQFLKVARKHVAAALAAAAMSGCAGGAYDSDTGRFIVAGPGQRGASSASPSDEVAAPSVPGAGGSAQGYGQGQPTAARQGGPSTAPSRGTAQADDGSGGFDPSSRTPPAPVLQADGAPMRPALAQVSPSSGSVGGGEEITITGSDFARVQVLFGSAPAQITSQSSNAVTVIAPQGNPGPATIVVTNRDGTYVVAGGAYTYR
jgi:rubrerythrin